MRKTEKRTGGKRSRLAGLRNFLVEQKYRFDIGTHFLSYVNLALLIIAVSDKLKQIVPWRISEFLIVLIPTAFILAWCLGFFLDRFVRYPQVSMRLVEARSPSHTQIHKKLDGILDELQKKKRKTRKRA